MEKTLVLIKPDGVKRKLVGEIISIYEKKNLNISSLKIVKADRALAENHYIEHKGRSYFEDLVVFITEDNLCAMIIEGENAIELVRKINGNKNPLEADMGSIRGRFSGETTKNLVHASDSIDSAKREMAIWFPEFKE
ncbi:nucleoside-diphosphate kinase [Desnuesiella massiliensis]|uniref:nucleoside-diphosphate kinase n=1 Tax=Desnuesiella massiliensis TaxID=1650662 RepID=UPI0006E32B80|nr:nucleoside-diphosphate kinase [Desnuesiella massiliensis]